MDVFGLIARYLANAPTYPDGIGARPRLDRRGEIWTNALWAGFQALAEEGSIFAAMTVPGTGVALTAATGTVFSATQGLLTIANTDTKPVTSGGKRVIALMVKLFITAAGTASTDLQIAHAIDAGNRGSAGTPGLLTPYNVNGGVGNDSIAQVRLGVPTIAAATASVRYVGRNLLRAAIPVVKDVYTIMFGAADLPSTALLAGATASLIAVPALPIILDPGQCYVMHEWSTARSAAQSGEGLIVWAER